MGVVNLDLKKEKLLKCEYLQKSVTAKSLEIQLRPLPIFH